jgi:predicted RNA-binding Zn-ribbon protein involved in translation (DUF1610 family)
MKGSFYCEVCGAEVKGHSDVCPSCGRSFQGVRCPRCGKEGNVEEFRNGCPECGYMADDKFPGAEISGGRIYRPERKKSGNHDWPASCYWFLSALIIIGLGLILYFWLG